MAREDYEVVIGLEVHAELSTKTHAIRLHLLPEHGRRDPTYSLPGRRCHEKHVS